MKKTAYTVSTCSWPCVFLCVKEKEGKYLTVSVMGVCMCAFMCAQLVCYGLSMVLL